MNKNPLLEEFDLPQGVPPFDRIEAEHYLPAVTAAIEAARANIATLKANPAPPDFKNAIVALETASDRLGMVTGIFYNQLSAAGTDALEKLAEEIGPLSAAFSSDVAMDPEIFKRVKAVYDGRDDLSLNAEERTLLDDTYKGFVRGGALLPPDQQARLKAINEQLSVIGPAFNNNTKKYADSFTLHITDEKDLRGLPDTAREGAHHAAEEKGLSGWLFTLDYPSYLPFITYADNRGLREHIWRAMAMKGYGGEFDNAPHIKKLIALKDERAKMLGYKHHADFVLERRMAKSPENVMAFLKKLLATYRPAAEKDLKALKDFARQSSGPEDIKPWDVAYYSEKLKEKTFHFSEEELRPYFPLEPVLKGVFEHFSRLFGLSFVPTKTYPVWHPDVTAYDVFDQETKRFMGVFYADFFPRAGKKAGAWKTAYRSQGLQAGEVKRPIVAIVCNFTKPTKDKPSLLTHDEVLTLFHEMGHATHALLSDVTYASHSGTSVLWDFVELPSQVQENWAYHKETLDLFAAHYQTGEKIPELLIAKVQAAKNFMGGWTGLRQVNLGWLDMAWHTADPDAVGDVAAFEDAATKDSTLFPRLAGPTSTSFSHIFGGGYSAGYYSYKWAEVLDADAFEAFEAAGLYDPDTAAAYRQEVLSKGGSEDPALLYRRFRGRDADPGALLRREGISS
jgi:peptidyl-dipeptidase Dcp